MIDCNIRDRQEQLYLEYKEKVSRYISAKITNPQEAEDLVSSVFVKVFAALPGFDERKASISTWIYTIARNTLTDYFRTARQHCELPEELVSGEQVEERLLGSEQLDELVEALLQLVPRERDLEILHYYHGHTLKAVAQRMGISYSYAKLLHSRALKELRGRLEHV